MKKRTDRNAMAVAGWFCVALSAGWAAAFYFWPAASATVAFALLAIGAFVVADK